MNRSTLFLQNLEQEFAWLCQQVAEQLEETIVEQKHNLHLANEISDRTFTLWSSQPDKKFFDELYCHWKDAESVSDLALEALLYLEADLMLLGLPWIDPIKERLKLQWTKLAQKEFAKHSSKLLAPLSRRRLEAKMLLGLTNTMVKSEALVRFKAN